jgi:hypothetical protein
VWTWGLLENPRIVSAPHDPHKSITPPAKEAL